MHRLVAALIVVLAGAGGAAIAVSAAGAQGTGSTGTATATHPAAHPRHATRRSHVSVHFTLSDAPGHQGVIESGYRIQVDAPAGSRAACAAPAPPSVSSGTQGARVVVALPAPRYGWCRGRYAATVFLQRGPYCPEPQAGQPPQPCPEFASQDLQVGRSAFLVRPAAH